jgi:hypothetical protein
MGSFPHGRLVSTINFKKKSFNVFTNPQLAHILDLLLIGSLAHSHDMLSVRDSVALLQFFREMR